MAKVTTKQRHVVRRKQKKEWAVVKDSHRKTSSTHGTKAEAEERAKEILGNAGGGEAVLHRKATNQIHDGKRVKAGGGGDHRHGTSDHAGHDHDEHGNYVHPRRTPQGYRHPEHGTALGIF